MLHSKTLLNQHEAAASTLAATQAAKLDRQADQLLFIGRARQAEFLANKAANLREGDGL